MERFNGTNIRTALKMDPDKTRLTMALMIKNVSDAVDANKRMSTMAEYADCVEWLLTDNFGGNYTLEDFRAICDELATAKTFGRLKRGEFISAWQAYDTKKTAAAHERNRLARIQAENEAAQRTQAMIEHRKQQQTKQREPQRPDRVAWMQGESRLTYSERLELQERDRERMAAQNQAKKLFQ